MLEKQLNRIEVFLKKLSPVVALELSKAEQIRTYKRGDLLLREGMVCRNSYQLENGMARKYVLLDGKEICTELYFPGDLALSFASYTLQTPSEECIEALSDVVVKAFDHQVFQALKKKHPTLMELDLLLSEYHAIWLEERMHRFRSMDAISHYRWLLEKESHLVQYVPLTHLASYLGISLETLSRIRAKI
jgi:CRP-like cAMP-binding protein